METQNPSWRSRLPRIGGLLFIALFIGGMIWLIKGALNSDAPKRPKMQIISLIKPPPPKPPEEKPPEPKKIEKPKEEVKIDEPKPAPPEEAPPPPAGGIPDGPASGMETDLGAGSGGIGIGGTGSGDRRAWYSRLITRQMEEELRRAKSLQGKDYRVAAQIWFNASGTVSRVEFDKGTGDNQLDEALRREILQVNLRDPFPPDLPQPVHLRVVSR